MPNAKHVSPVESKNESIMDEILQDLRVSKESSLVFGRKSTRSFPVVKEDTGDSCKL